jgi:toxin YoeB
MEIIYKSKALRDIAFWKRSGQKQIQRKISALIHDICKHPTSGLGKPEELKYELKGLWSRRINSEHRIIYEFNNDQIIILSLKGHY